MSEPDWAAIEATLKAGRYSVLFWSPSGIPGTHGAAYIPIGVLYGREDGAGAIGLLNAASLAPVEAALNAKQQLGEIDWLFIDSIRQQRQTPDQARAQWPGTQQYCYQIWSVGAPWPIVHSADPEAVVHGLWSRLGGLPLVTVESWAAGAPA